MFLQVGLLNITWIPIAYNNLYMVIAFKKSIHKKYFQLLFPLTSISKRICVHTNLIMIKLFFKFIIQQRMEFGAINKYDEPSNHNTYK